LRKGEPGGSYGESVPWLEALASDILGPREAPTWTLDKINESTTQRFFKTHATVANLPRGRANIKIIYVYRNPKDVLVSLYHHAKNKPEFEYSGDFETFFELFLAGNVESGSWFDHFTEWAKECHDKPGQKAFSIFL
jgi:hypothetical protein